MSFAERVEVHLTERLNELPSPGFIKYYVSRIEYFGKEDLRRDPKGVVEGSDFFD